MAGPYVVLDYAGMIGDSALEAGRIRANSLMQDACTITVPGTGEPVYDKVHNVSVDPERVTLYSGPCRVRTPRLLAGTQAAVGPDMITQVYFVVSIPVGSLDPAGNPVVVPKAARVTITTARHDPVSPGGVFVVNAVQHVTQATAMKMQCIEEQMEAAS